MSRVEKEPMDARGIYASSGTIRVYVKEPQDLIAAGIQISFEAAAITWGNKKASEYISAMNPKKP